LQFVGEKDVFVGGDDDVLKNYVKLDDKDLVDKFKWTTIDLIFPKKYIFKK
jgi:hypothetical protein